MSKSFIKTISLLVLALLIFTGCSSSNTSSNENSNASSNANSSTGATETQEGNKDPIIIGSTLSLTGGPGFLGSGMKEVFDLVVKQTNENGGINGRPLEIIYYDDEGDPEKTVQNAQRLIKKDGVNIIIGPSLASTTTALQPLVEREKVIMFSLSNTYIPPADSYIFNTSLSGESGHEIHHEWLIENGIKKVGFLATTDSSGDIATNIINEKFQGQDGIEYVIERMGLDSLDLTPQLTRLRGEGIEALIVIGPGSPPTIAIKNAGQLGMDMPILLIHSQASNIFAKSIEGFIPDQLFITGTGPMAYDQLDDKNPLKPEILKIAKAFKEEYNKEIDHVGAVGYDAITSVIKGIEMADSDDPDKIKEVFETQFKDVMLTTGIVNYTTEDHQGTDMRGAVLLRLDPDLSWNIQWEPKFWEQ
ncbi:ABC transporter substrate-binding protein [Bacillus sp. Marseille-P3661]|uniref:ABC transporter substrate-binding protein n=1 Tax=Bacillus sp. Marseille-P3661 TaxID=1936234 RepID=UPI000C8258F6|nr:ABC transporter substrate-binding protein [Bacillus sp. Marseille-P3661]